MSESENLSETTYATPSISNPPSELRVPTPLADVVAAGVSSVVSSVVSVFSSTVSSVVVVSSVVDSLAVLVDEELDEPPIVSVVLLPELADEETIIEAVPSAAAENTISPDLPEKETALPSDV